MTRIRVALCALGTLVAGYGLIGLVSADHGPEPLRYAIFAAAVLLGHDLVLAPLALVAGAGLVALVPAGPRGTVRAGLVASAIVTLVALPFVLGYGYQPKVPSALPLDYTRGWLITLAAIWLAVAVALAVRVATQARAGVRR